MLPFNPTEFKTDYPQFAALSDTYLTKVYDNEALVLGTKVIGCVTGDSQRAYYADLVLAHILTVSGQGSTGTGQTGRISQASEGDVSGSFDYPTTLDNAWWSQTVYGQKCWQLINQRGGFTYFPDCNNGH